MALSASRRLAESDRRLQQTLVDACRGLCRRPVWVPLSIGIVASIVAYSSLLTELVFTNHTIPNVFLYPYPSFKTFTEGRWFADILIALFGGGGTQSFQALAGFVIEAINGLLLAKLLRVERVFGRTLVVLLVVLHPAILDYYAFTVDNISFTLGDTLVLGAFLLVDRHRGWGPVVGAAVFVTLALAIYPPKLGVVAVVGCGWLLARLNPYRQTWRGEALMLARMVAAVLGGLALYGLTLALTLRNAAPERTHINALPEMLATALQSYEQVWTQIRMTIGWLPTLGDIGFLGLLAAGLSVHLVRLGRRPGWPLLFGIVALVALPPALMLPKIINASSWEWAGRIFSGFAYALPILAAPLLRGGLPLRRLGQVMTLLVVYGLAIGAVQANGWMAMKSLAETELISRLAGRIEALLPDAESRPLVVFGKPVFSGDAFVGQRPAPLRAQVLSPTFESYRQVPILHFFMGNTVLRGPTPEEVAAARAGAEGRPSWPAAGSVYLQDGIVVILLELPTERSPVTWP